jgi:hypothetical protein
VRHHLFWINASFFQFYGLYANLDGKAWKKKALSVSYPDWSILALFKKGAIHLFHFATTQKTAEKKLN